MPASVCPIPPQVQSRRRPARNRGGSGHYPCGELLITIFELRADGARAHMQIPLWNISPMLEYGVLLIVDVVHINARRPVIGCVNRCSDAPDCNALPRCDIYARAHEAL